MCIRLSEHDGCTLGWEGRRRGRGRRRRGRRKWRRRGRWRRRRRSRRWAERDSLARKRLCLVARTNSPRSQSNVEIAAVAVRESARCIRLGLIGSPIRVRECNVSVGLSPHVATFGCIVVERGPRIRVHSHRLHRVHHLDILFGGANGCE